MSLLLVPLSGRHARALRALATEEPVARGVSLRALVSRDDVLGFIVRAQRLRARRAGAVFAVCQDGAVVGLVALAARQPADDHAELGFWIAPSFRGHGLATAAARQAVEHGFERLRVPRIVARSQSGNRPSVRVLEKVGFRLAGLETVPGPGSIPGSVRRYELVR